MVYLLLFRKLFQFYHMTVQNYLICSVEAALERLPKLRKAFARASSFPMLLRSPPGTAPAMVAPSYNPVRVLLTTAMVEPAAWMGRIKPIPLPKWIPLFFLPEAMSSWKKRTIVAGTWAPGSSIQIPTPLPGWTRLRFGTST